MFAVLAFTLLPSVVTFAGIPPAGQLNCLTPSSCASSSSLSVGGPGDTAVATVWLHSTTNLPSGSTVTYYACVTGTASCSSNTGTSNGWSWTFGAGTSPGPLSTTGTTGTGGACTGSSCEGNGIGSPSTLTLEVTAPTTVTSSNNAIGLTLFACSSTGSSTNCANLLAEVASLSVVATVPQFGLGMGLALAIGLVGFLAFFRKRSLSLPTVTTL